MEGKQHSLHHLQPLLQQPMTFHFLLDLKTGDGGRPARCEWQAGDKETALQIVTDLHPEFDVTYTHQTY